MYDVTRFRQELEAKREATQMNQLQCAAELRHIRTAASAKVRRTSSAASKENDQGDEHEPTADEGEFVL